MIILAGIVWLLGSFWFLRSLRSPGRHIKYRYNRAVLRKVRRYLFWR